jgi:hypothetical protein
MTGLGILNSSELHNGIYIGDLGVSASYVR